MGNLISLCKNSLPLLQFVWKTFTTTALENTVLGPRVVTPANRSPWIMLPRHLDTRKGKCPLISSSCPARWIRSWPCLSLLPWQACTTSSSLWYPIACVPSWLQLLARGRATSGEFLLQTDRRTDKRNLIYIMIPENRYLFLVNVMMNSRYTATWTCYSQHPTPTALITLMYSTT